MTTKTPDASAPKEAPLAPIRDTTTPVPATTAEALAERYGRTPRARRRVRWWAGGIAAGIVLVFAGWVIWGGPLDPSSLLEASDTGSTVLDDSSVTIRWNLTVEPRTQTSCALQALNESFTIVGWKIVNIPPSLERTRSFSETVRTSELSVSGLIYRCWLS